MHSIAFLLVNLALLIVANNINPGGRSHGGSWTDSDSNIWTFGGWGFDASGQEGFLNDLWMFSPSNNSWHWINGSQSISALGVYTGPNAFPGARESPMIWITPDRRTVYMFGGYGFAETGPLGYLQDMWRFDIATRVWTWIKGPRDTTNGPSNTAATPDAIPSGRYRSSAWTYSSTSLYLFGGAEAGGNLNDVWWFDIPSNTWAFIGGTTALNWYGTYGTTESTSNIPGGRVMTATWKDKDNMFWLYGGAGYASVNGQLGYLSDVWRFNPQTRGWTFIAGSATVNTPGNYGVFGVSSGGIPPPRLSSMGWFDSDSNEVVIFGGSSGESNGQTIAVQNDVWRFRPSTKEFIWVGGDPTPDQLGRFGDIGVPSKYNIPSARVASYIGQSGDNAYLFGGAHVYHNRPGTIVRLNDMWHLHLPTNIWTWLDGTNLPNQRTIYEAPDFNILSLPEYLSGNIHIEDIFTHEKWAGSFIKNSAGSNWNVSSVITNQEKRASLIYANGALVLREENSETTACFDPSEVLSDDVVGAAVKKAKQLYDNEIKDPTVLECVGTKWEVNVLQELYVVCRENATSNWKIFGINFVATLTDLVTSPFQSRKRNVELDSSLFSNLFNCSKADNEVPPFVEAVKWYARDWRNVENKNFECIFLHGEGMDHQTFSTSNNPTAYWSNIGDFTPQCTSKKFVEIDTLKRGWTDTSLQQDFCQVITGNRTGGEAQNKLIFAHSMGNLVLGAAIKNNYCTLGDSAYWYNIQGPNKGTQIAAFMAKACSEEGYNAPITEWLVKAALELEGINYTPGTLASALRLALGVGGYCNLNTFQLYPAYTTLIPTATNSQEFDSILETIQNNVHGGMCGTSAIGLASFNSIPSQLWHSLSAWDKSVGSTDGFVPLDSCKVFTKDFGKFSASYTNSHYLARVNNFDGRCIRSDGWWGVDRKPCLWYANQGLTETAYQPPTTVSSGYVVCPTLAGAGLLLVILGL